MAKYKVIKNFTDKYNSNIKYKVGDELTFDDKRANEILKVDKLIEKIEEKPVKNEEIIEDLTENSTENEVKIEEKPVKNTRKNVKK